MKSLLAFLVGAAMTWAPVMADAHALAIHCPAPGRPPGMRLSWVAPRAAVDGLPLAILRFASPLPVHALQTWYWRRWRRFGGRPIVYSAASWHVIARYRGGCFETVQFKARGLGSHGFVGLSEPGQAVTEDAQPMDFPMPPGGRVLLTLASDDHGKRAETFVALIPYGVDGPFYYRHTLLHLGWAVQMNRRGGGGRGLIFQKRGTVADLSFTPMKGGATSALISLVSH